MSDEIHNIGDNSIEGLQNEIIRLTMNLQDMKNAMQDKDDMIKLFEGKFNRSQAELANTEMREIKLQRQLEDAGRMVLNMQTALQAQEAATQAKTVDKHKNSSRTKPATNGSETPENLNG